MTPRRLMAELDLDTAPLDEADAYLAKHNPDQPRVPAGGGAASGRWVGADGAFGFTGSLRVSQIRFDAAQVAANGPSPMAAREPLSPPSATRSTRRGSTS